MRKKHIIRQANNSVFRVTFSFILTLLVFCFGIQTLSQAQDSIKLPAPQITGGKPLMEALSARHSSRAFSNTPLPQQLLSNLLWAANGYNRITEKKRTAPSSMNYQEIEIYLAMENKLYKWDPEKNILLTVLNEDIRAYCGKQDFVKTAPLNLIYVANYTKFDKPVTEYQYRASYANTGFISQNVYLFCASENLAVVIRAYFDETELSKIMKLGEHQKIILCQTIGFPPAKN